MAEHEPAPRPHPHPAGFGQAAGDSPVLLFRFDFEGADCTGFLPRPVLDLAARCETERFAVHAGPAQAVAVHQGQIWPSLWKRWAPAPSAAHLALAMTNQPGPDREQILLDQVDVAAMAAALVTIWPMTSQSCSVKDRGVRRSSSWRITAMEPGNTGGSAM